MANPLLPGASAGQGAQGTAVPGPCLGTACSVVTVLPFPALAPCPPGQPPASAGGVLLFQTDCLLLQTGRSQIQAPTARGCKTRGLGGLRAPAVSWGHSATSCTRWQHRSNDPPEPSRPKLCHSTLCRGLIPRFRRDRGTRRVAPEPTAPAQLLPDALHLQLGLRPRILRFHCLIRNDGTNGAACPHVVEHDVLRREAAMVKQKRLDACLSKARTRCCAAPAPPGSHRGTSCTARSHRPDTAEPRGLS